MVMFKNCYGRECQKSQVATVHGPSCSEEESEAIQHPTVPYSSNQGLQSHDRVD
jgi:hypothetical protein